MCPLMSNGARGTSPGPIHTPMWGDIPAKGWRISPPGKSRGMSCCRDEIAVLKCEEGMGRPGPIPPERNSGLRGTPAMSGQGSVRNSWAVKVIS